MSIEHSAIPDAQRHAPKGASTATNKQIWVASGADAGSFQRITETTLDYSDKTKNLFGWNDISDNAYTVGSPLAISSGVRTLLPNNGLASQSDTSRLGAIWDATNKQFLINDLNAVYIARIKMNVKAAAAAGTPYVIKFEAESTNGPTIISATDYTIKGGGYENAITHTTFLYSGSFINNYPLKLYVTPDTNITVYSIGFVIQRIYKET